MIFYDFFVRRNENVQREYERYVMEHTEEHYEKRFLHWKILMKLNWHYRVKKKNEPMLYFDENNRVKAEKNTKVQSVGAKHVGSSPARPQVDINKMKKVTMQTTFTEQNRRLKPFWLAKNLLQYDIVSFDVFDTLLFRPVSKPEDVFILVGQRLNIVDFVEIRVNAEKKVRDLHRAQYGNHEVTLHQIYEEIERKTGIDAKKGESIEIETEYELIYPNTYMKCVFDILKAQGKKIIAVSDMYLSAEVINGLLKKCGYVVDELFVSCEYQCNKRNMGLYKQVLGKYSGKKIIHVGDNYKTDIENASNMGLDTSFYRNCRYIGEELYPLEGMSELVGSFYKGIVNNTIFNGANNFNSHFEYGYLYGGLYVLGFCNWIKRKAETEGVDKILFLARDGFIYQKVFEQLNSKVDSSYVYWSRIVSTLSNIKDNRYDFLKRLIDHKAVSVNQSKVADVLKIIGVSEQDIQLKKYGLREEMVLCNENKAFLENAIIDNYETILKKNQKRDEQIKIMLKEIIGDSRKIAVVDVGWTGSSDITIKHLVENVYKWNCEVKCYLAASKVKNNVANIVNVMDEEIETYMFSQIHNRNLYDYHARANKGTNSIYFELFTQACSPSFKGVLEDSSFEFDVAEVENYQMIEDIHRGILLFVKQYLNFANKFSSLLNISGYDAYLPYCFISKNLDYIKKYFKDFSYARGVGGTFKIETIEEIMKSCKL